MTLRQKQSKFVNLVALLIEEATRQGFALTFGEAYRSAEEAARLAAKGAGIAKSLHTQRLAIDLNLFDSAGVYLRLSESHRPLGEWWEQQSGAEWTCCWGGRWGDGNHYSLAHGGRK